MDGCNGQVRPTLQRKFRGERASAATSTTSNTTGSPDVKECRHRRALLQLLALFLEVQLVLLLLALVPQQLLLLLLVLVPLLMKLLQWPID